MKIDWFYVTAMILVVGGFIAGVISVSHFGMEPILQEPDCGITCRDEPVTLIPVIFLMGAIGLLIFGMWALINLIVRLSPKEKDLEKEDSE